MIRNLYKIGKILKEDPDFQEAFLPWGNPFPGKSADQAKVVWFDIKQGVLDPELHLESFKPKKIDEYLYRKIKGSRGTNLVPTFFFYPDSNPEKNEENVRKLVGRVKASSKNYKHPFLNAENELTKLSEALAAFAPEPDVRYLLTFKLDGKWLGEYEKYRELFEKEAYSKYHEKSKGKNKVCSVTYQEVPEVWGRIDTLGFTVNEDTFSRSGFNTRDSYKMFPASPEAVKILEGMRRLIGSKLAHRFFDLKYFVLPHAIGKDEDYLEEILAQLIRSGENNGSLEKQSASIFNNERLMYDIASDDDLAQANVYYDIFFYQENKAQFLVKLHLADVMPSQLGKIFQVKEIIEKRYERILEVATEKYSASWKLTFQKIVPYFSTKSGSKTHYQPFFFRILEAVFYGDRLNEMEVIKAFMKKIRKDLKERHDKSWAFTTSVKEAFALYHFFLFLNLFKKTHQTMSDPSKNSSAPLNWADFEKNHPDFFAIPYKKAAFLMGCLTQILLRAQAEHYGHKQETKAPFMNQIAGLNFDEKDLKKLWLKVNDKLNQYARIQKADGKGLIFFPAVETLKAQITPILMQPCDLSRAELSFAFSAGMVMNKEFGLAQWRESQKKTESDSE